MSETNIDENDWEDVAWNIENTIQRALADYDYPWKGILGETIQNSYDGWCTNRFERQTIAENAPLTIAFDIDTTEQTITIMDNAGGMPKSTFLHNFAGLDTPGEEKQGGGAGGSYGRGFYVIAGTGSRARAETIHETYHGGLLIDVQKGKQKIVDPPNQIRTAGTWVEIQDCNSQVISNLSDWEQVRRHVQARFQPLLEHENVSVIVRIDGNEREVPAVDLSGFEILHGPEDVKFELNGETKVIEDFIVYKKDGADVPFKNISLFKRNTQMDQPFMRVKDYRPQARHIDRVFAFCDASTLCPEYENNAHTDLRHGVASKTGLRNRLQTVLHEEFSGGPRDLEERNDLVNRALERVHEIWEENPFDNISESDIETRFNTESSNGGEAPGIEDLTESTGQELGVAESAEDGEQTVSSDLGDEAERSKDFSQSLPQQPVVRCNVRKRTHKPGETVDLRVSIDNPSSSGVKDFEIDGRIEYAGGSTTQLGTISVSVPAGEQSSGVEGWEFDPDDEEGKFTFTASLREEGSDESLDKSGNYFYVGDSVGANTSSSTGTFIKQVENFPEVEDSFRYELLEEQDGYTMMVNWAHPEWERAEEINKRVQGDAMEETLVRWMNEAICWELLSKKVETELEGITGHNSSDLENVFKNFIRDVNMDKLSTMVARTYQ